MHASTHAADSILYAHVRTLHALPPRMILSERARWQWRGAVLFGDDPAQSAAPLQLKLKADMSAGWAIVGTSARRRSRAPARVSVNARVGACACQYVRVRACVRAD
jgi:hypothetical protein